MLFWLRKSTVDSFPYYQQVEDSLKQIRIAKETKETMVKRLLNQEH